METNNREAGSTGLTPDFHTCNDTDRTEDTMTEMPMEDFTMNWMNRHSDSAEERSEGWSGTPDEHAEMMEDKMEDKAMEMESSHRDSRMKNTSGGY